MDSTLGIARKGYVYFSRKFERHDTDIYTTRLLFKKTTAIRGREAAQLFSDQQKLIRQGATPKRFQKTLFGQGGVQGLDGKQHLHRKALFMSIMGAENLSRLDLLYEKHWESALYSWKEASSISLFEESQKVLTRAVCQWSGVPLPEEQAGLRARQLSEMIDGAGGVAGRYFRGKTSRKKAEKWIRSMVRDIRRNKLQLPQDSVFYKFAMHRDLEGELLHPQIVAVEMLNILRPTVAIARYVVFLAHALHLYPIYHEKLKNNQDMAHFFVQEVRRHYPFFPFTAAKVKEAFRWKGHEFRKGQRVLLDLYATNHDKRLWHQPGVFFPERFAQWEENPWDLIPQGTGNHEQNHRCAGEWITINLMKITLNMLVNRMDYKVPGQDLDIDLSRIPAIPKSRFIISNIIQKSYPAPDASATQMA